MEIKAGTFRVPGDSKGNPNRREAERFVAFSTRGELAMSLRAWRSELSSF